MECLGRDFALISVRKLKLCFQCYLYECRSICGACTVVSKVVLFAFIYVEVRTNWDNPTCPWVCLTNPNLPSNDHRAHSATSRRRHVDHHTRRARSTVRAQNYENSQEMVLLTMTRRSLFRSIFRFVDTLNGQTVFR